MKTVREVENDPMHSRQQEAISVILLIILTLQDVLLIMVTDINASNKICLALKRPVLKMAPCKNHGKPRPSGSL